MTISDKKDIVNAFADHFASVYENKSNCLLNTLEEIPDFAELNITSFKFSILEILESLNNVDLSKGAGPDGLTPKFLKNCFFSLSRPLWLIFNESIASGVFPDYWKTSYISPIFKNGGKRNCVSDYRPISKISVIPKIMESLITNFLKNSFKNIIISNQHGFTKGRSITTIY